MRKVWNRRMILLRRLRARLFVSELVVAYYQRVTRDSLIQLIEEKILVVDGAPIKNRRYLLTTYKKCVPGKV